MKSRKNFELDETGQVSSAIYPESIVSLNDGIGVSIPGYPTIELQVKPNTKFMFDNYQMSTFGSYTPGRQFKTKS